jgi:hypothetical protein
MNRLTFKMMSALLAALLTVSACSSTAATPTTNSNTNPSVVVPPTSKPTQAAPASTIAPVAAPTDTPAPRPQVTTVVSPAQNAIDACTLVTKDEATQAIGGQLQDGTKNSKQYSSFAQGLGLGSATISTCTYLGQAAAAQYVNVVVLQFTGMSSDAVIQEFKTKMGQDPKMTALSGLGDLAYGMPSTVIVLKGTSALIVSVVSSPQDLVAGKYDKAQALATVALTRLP